MNSVCSGLNGFRPAPTGAVITARVPWFLSLFHAMLCSTRFADEGTLLKLCDFEHETCTKTICRQPCVVQNSTKTN